MSRPVTVRLLPDAEQHDLLADTLERVNKACNAARTRAIDGKVRDRAGLRAIVKEELERYRLPASLTAPSVARVEASLQQKRFGAYQSVVLPPTALKWPSTDRVTLPTALGRRTVRVYVDPRRGALRPPLEGKDAALVFRNGEFELVEVQPAA